MMFMRSQPKAIIGLSTMSGAAAHDTIGVLVSSVRRDSPAERAGIGEGDRIASVNGVSLRLSAADIGDEEMANVLSRRLSRELDKVNPGDEVELRVVKDGQPKTLKIKAVSPAELAEASPDARFGDRPTLGIDVTMTGSARDSLGIFVMAVDDAGPAAKAGIIEGSRIASINGVDLRASRSADDSEPGFRLSNANRLQRELARAKPGEDVRLRVLYNGQYRDVTVKPVRTSDLPRHRRSFTVIRGDTMMAFGGPIVNFDMRPIMADVNRAMDGFRFGGFGRRVDW